MQVVLDHLIDVGIFEHVEEALYGMVADGYGGEVVDQQQEDVIDVGGGQLRHHSPLQLCGNPLKELFLLGGEQRQRLILDDVELFVTLLQLFAFEFAYLVEVADVQVLFGTGHPPVHVNPLGFDFGPAEQMVDTAQLFLEESIELCAHTVLPETAALLLFEGIFGGDDVQPLEGIIFERAFDVLDGEFFPASSVHKLEARFQEAPGFGFDERLHQSTDFGV